MRLLRQLVLLLPLFPPAAFANSWFFGNTGGTMTFNPTTDTLTMTSTITTLIGVGANGVSIVTTGSDLGTISLTTGPLISGSLLHNAVFNGGTITLSLEGTGTIDQPIGWWVDKQGDSHLGVGPGIVGSFPDGVQIFAFRQLVVSSGPNQYNVIQGATVTPEPGTMVLVATGMAFLACWTKSRRHPV
jgi:hypothetical protein